MKWTILICLLLFLLVGCATTETETVWVKPGATQQDFYTDKGQCDAQALSVPGMNLLQAAVVGNSCMRGKGWHLEERPAR
jgi:uncharacterized protein YcfL